MFWKKKKQEKSTILCQKCEKITNFDLVDMFGWPEVVYVKIHSENPPTKYNIVSIPLRIETKKLNEIIELEFPRARKDYIIRSGGIWTSDNMLIAPLQTWFSEGIKKGEIPTTTLNIVEELLS